MSLRMGSNQGSSRRNALDKRVPRNPRYAGVKSKVKTGMTVDKVTFITTRQHLRRQEEPYFRLTPSQLSELLSEYEQDQQEGVQDFRDHIDPDNHGPKVVEYEADASPSYDRPYLILDVRAPEEFQRCRIMQARSFEAKLLNQDRMTPELYRYKNRDGGLVVLYSDDDAEACQAARTFIHRGFDNIFVLSGGLTTFCRGGFHDFVEGDVESLSPSAAPASSCGGGGAGSLRGGGGGSGDGSLRGGMPNGSTTSRPHGTLRAREFGTAHAHDDNSSTTSSRNLGGRGSGSGSGIGGGRLEYRCRGGQSVVVRNGGSIKGSVNGSTATGNGCRSGSLRDGVEGSRQHWGVGSVQRGRGGGRGKGEAGEPGGYSAGRAGVAAAAAKAVPCRGGRGGAKGEGKGDRFESRAGFRGGAPGGRGGGLAEAAAAASVARRRSLEREQGGGGGGGGDMSKGSAITVADSVISRSTARRGRW